MPGQYYLGAEESAPLFDVDLGEISIIVGAVWGVLWNYSAGLVSPLAWLVLGLLVAVLFNLFIQRLIRARFQHPLNNAKVTEIVDRAAQRLGITDHIEVWSRESDRLTCMATRNLVFAAVLLSDMAVRDIVRDPENAEVVVAYKLAGAYHSNPVRRLMVALGAFFLGLSSESFFLFRTISEISSIPYFVSTMVLLVAIMLFSVLIVILFARRSYRDGPLETVEELYEIPPPVAILRLFSKAPISDQKVAEYRDRKASALKEEAKSETLRNLKRSAIVAFVSTILALIFVVRVIGFSTPPRIVFSVIFLVVGAGIPFILTFVVTQFLASGKPGNGSDADREEEICRSELDKEIEKLIGSSSIGGGMSVRTLRGEDGVEYVAVYDSPDPLSGKRVLALVPHIVDLLGTADMLAPYILYETRREALVSRYERLIFALSFGSLIVLIAVMLASFFSSTFSLDVDQTLIMFFAWIFVIFPVIYVWFRHSTFELDVRLAREFPRYVEMLHRLYEDGYGTPYMGYPLRKRLEYLSRRGFESANLALPSASDSW